jgi:hypothetical protein
MCWGWRVQVVERQMMSVVEVAGRQPNWNFPFPITALLKYCVAAAIFRFASCLDRGRNQVILEMSMLIIAYQLVNRDVFVTSPITNALWYAILAVNVTLFVGGVISLICQWSTMTTERKKKWLFWVIL